MNQYISNPTKTLNTAKSYADTLFSLKDHMAAQNHQISVQKEVIDYLLQISCKQIIFSNIRPCMN